MSRLIRFALLVFLPALWPSIADVQTAAKQRPSWTSSRITGSPEPPRPYVAERIFPSLEFNQPLELVAVPGSSRLVILEAQGKIYSFENRPAEAALTADLFANIRERDPKFDR